MKEKKSPASAPFIISFIVIDLIVMGIFIALKNYVYLGEGFFTSLISISWLILLVIAVIALILSIILIKDYLDLRTALAEGLMLLIFSLWFGFARVPLMNADGEGSISIFTVGSILLLIVNIIFQIDLLCAPKIKNFLTTDKENRKTDKKSSAAFKADLLFPADSPAYQNRAAQGANERANRYARYENQETKRFSASETKTLDLDATTVKPASRSVQTARPTQQPMTEEQLKQFREHQAKRRAARAAAAQQLKDTKVQFDKLTPPAGRTARRNYEEHSSSASQGESLFFKDEQ